MPESWNWSELNRIGHWVMEGPRSIMFPDDEIGAKHGWLTSSIVWSAVKPNSKRETWKLFIFQWAPDKESTPLQWMLRHCVWDIADNRQQFKDGRQELLIRVAYFCCEKSKESSALVALDNAFEQWESAIGLTSHESSLEIAKASQPHTFHGLKFSTRLGTRTYSCQFMNNDHPPIDMWNSTLDIARTAANSPLGVELFVERYSVDVYQHLVDVRADRLSEMPDLL